MALGKTEESCSCVFALLIAGNFILLPGPTLRSPDIPVFKHPLYEADVRADTSTEFNRCAGVPRDNPLLFQEACQHRIDAFF